MTGIQTPIGGWHRTPHLKADPEWPTREGVVEDAVTAEFENTREMPVPTYPWEGKLHHELRDFEGGVHQYWDNVSRQWVTIPKSQHWAYKVYRRKLYKQLPLREKILDSSAPLGTRILFLVTIPITAPVFALFVYIRGLIKLEDW